MEKYPGSTIAGITMVQFVNDSKYCKGEPIFINAAKVVCCYVGPDKEIVIDCGDCYYAVREDIVNVITKLGGARCAD